MKKEERNMLIDQTIYLDTLGELIGLVLDISFFFFNFEFITFITWAPTQVSYWGGEGR